jgi:hypothetical protein
LDDDLPRLLAAGRTRRYFAEPGSSQASIYTLALVLLMEYARNHAQEFVFGPLDVSAARAGGLIISGADLTGPARVLEGVPGLAEYSPGAEEAVPARLAQRAGLGDPRGRR